MNAGVVFAYNERAKCKAICGGKWSTVVWRLHADAVRESRTVALAQNRVEQEIEIAYHAGLVVVLSA